MRDTDSDLAARLATRICHDLISPLGALGNGMELWQLSGGEPSAEMTLMNESLRHALARTRFFRLAFGVACQDQTIPRAEVISILADLFCSGRISVAWESAASLDRRCVQIAMLGLNCLESVLPRGGEVAIHQLGDEWTLNGSGPEVLDAAASWSVATGKAPAGDLPPARVHFALMAARLAEAGRSLHLSQAPLQLRF